MPRLKPSTAAYSKEKSIVKKALKELGAENIKISNGYYYFSGFATLPNGVIIYFSYSAPRDSWEPKQDVLIRKAKSYEDYQGFSNTFCKPTLKNIKEHIQNYFLK